MPKTNTLQTNLTSGEVSPYMFGRVETTKYVNGAAEVTNFFTKPQGPAVRRSGTSYKGDAVSNSDTVRIISFIFSDVQAYVLEFSDFTMRVWKNGVLQTPLNGGANDYITTPFAHADVDALSFAQSADVLFIAHADYPPQKVSRTGDKLWAIEELDIVKGPFLEENEAYDEQLKIVLPTLLTQAISNITTTSAVATVTSNGHGLYTGERVVLFRSITGGGSVDLPERYSITRVDANDFTLQNEDTGDDIAGNSLNTARPYTDWVYSEDSSLMTCTSALFIAGEAANTGVEFKDQVDSEWRLAATIHKTWETSSQVWVDRFDLRYKSLPEGTNLGFNDHNSYDKLHANFSGVFEPGDVGNYFRENAFRSDSSTDGNANWFLSTGIDFDGSSVVIESHKIIVNGTPFVMHNGDAGYVHDTDVCLDSRRYMQQRLYYEPGIFSTTDVGRKMKLRYGANIVYCEILSVHDDAGGGSYRYASVDMDRNVPKDPETHTQTRFNNGVTTAYAFGAWHTLSTDGKLNYPAEVVLHDGRLVFAKSATQPSTVWMSVLDDFTNFAPVEDDGAVLPDSAVTLSLASGRVDAIKWLSSGPTLMVGTTGGEWQISAGSSNKEAITPSNVKASLQSGFGSVDDAVPVRIGSGLIFLARTGRNVRELSYSFNADQWDAVDLSVIAEHLLREAGTKCVQMAYQQEPNSVIHFERSDGKVVTLTYNKEQQIGAWATQDYASSTLSQVKSIAVVPSSDGVTDDVYFIMERTITSGTVQYMEKQEPEFFYTGLIADKLNMKFSDSHITANPVSNVVSGLDHLEGETTVIAIVDGVEEGPFTVTSGDITISSGDDTRTVHAGLPYTSAVKLLPLGAGSAYGNGYGKVKRVDKVSVRVQDSLYATMQFRDGGTVYWTNNGELLNRDESDTADPTPFSGVYDVKPDHSYEDTDAQLVIETSSAYPLNLLWIGMELMTNE